MRLYSWLSILSISFKRLRSKLLLAVLLILSIALILGIVVSVPVFAGGVSQLIMQEEFGLRTKRRNRPPFSMRFYTMATPRRPINLEDADLYQDWISHLLNQRIRLPLELIYTESNSPPYHLRRQDDNHYQEGFLDSVRVAHVRNIKDYIEIGDGLPFGEVSSSEHLSVWIEQNYANELAMQVGDVYSLGDPYSERAESTPVRIEGFWEAVNSGDHFWYRDPSLHFSATFLTTRSEYEKHVYPRLSSKTDKVSWYFVFDDSLLNLSRADHYIEALTSTAQEVGERLPQGGMDNAPIQELSRGSQRKQALTIILLSFSVPVMVITVYFIAALSVMLMRFREQEISTLVSRGSGRFQILGLAFAETLILLVLAVPLGVFVGMLLARLLGYSLSFLHFIPREPLAVHLVSADWRLVILTVVTALVARTVPSWCSSKQTVVMQERERARQGLGFSSLRFLLIGFFVLITYYAYHRLSQAGALGLVNWQMGNSANDPLPLFAPTFFLLVAPVIASELFVILTLPLGWVAKIIKRLDLHLACVNLGRESSRYRIPVHILTLCMTLGVFYASLAKSSDIWLTERRRYEVGADLRFSLREEDNDSDSLSVTADAMGSDQVFQLPVDEYESIEGIREAMPVGDYKAAMHTSQVSSHVRLLAIDRLKFPSIAYYQSDYSQRSLGDLMNQLGVKENSVLISSKIATELQATVDEELRVNLIVDEDTTQPLDFVIVGTFDYFPTMTSENTPILVANLGYLQTVTGGFVPYDIWARLAPSAESEQVLERITHHIRAVPSQVKDLRHLLAEDQRRLERVGIFGTLSVCFLAGAILAVLALLVHGAGSVRRRLLHFTVFRTLGMNRNTILISTFIEYGMVLFYSIISGAALGVFSVHLYVPFFRLTGEPEIPIPPYIPIVDRGRAVLIAATMLIATILVVVGILIRLLRMRLFEMVRVGMRE